MCHPAIQKRKIYCRMATIVKKNAIQAGLGQRNLSFSKQQAGLGQRNLSLSKQQQEEEEDFILAPQPGGCRGKKRQPPNQGAAGGKRLGTISTRRITTCISFMGAFGREPSVDLGQI